MTDCPKGRPCESPHFVSACASVGIEHQQTTTATVSGVVCADCPLLGLKGCRTYTDAPSLDHLCESVHEGHRCRHHWQGTGHLTQDDEDNWTSTCVCACGIRWPS